MDTPPGITVALQSYPGADLTLPYGSQLLTPHQSAASQSLDLPELRSRIQTRLRQERAASADLNGRSTCRLLLLLPDKTRRQNATRLTLDALLELAEQEQGWSVEIVFGLGTHPLMNDADIAQIVGHERLQKIKLLGVRLQQQTTLCSLSVRTITVPAPPQLSGGINGNHESAEVHLNVPEILWHSDIILVAGDTDLHPYEGRGGSGGINKMIAIGIGCLNTIRMTHCMDILTHSQTRPGEAKNRFVEMVDYFAAAIIKSAMHPAGSLHQKPLGISVIARHSDQPEAFWIGSCEQERASLLKQLKKERTLELRESVNIVITDTETAKATDLLAGARSLHFLCLYDDNNNRLISESSTHKTAIMYNQCHQISNANGIGNTGTVLHLNALKTFALEALRKSQDLDPTAIPNDDQTDTRKVAIARQLKHAVLSRWEQYLQLVSEEDQVFAELEQALVELQKGKAKNLEVIALIDERLPHSFGEHRHV